MCKRTNVCILLFYGLILNAGDDDDDENHTKIFHLFVWTIRACASGLCVCECGLFIVRLVSANRKQTLGFVRILAGPPINSSTMKYKNLKSFAIGMATAVAVAAAFKSIYLNWMFTRLFNHLSVDELPPKIWFLCVWNWNRRGNSIECILKFAEFRLPFATSLNVKRGPKEKKKLNKFKNKCNCRTMCNASSPSDVGINRSCSIHRRKRDMRECVCVPAATGILFLFNNFAVCPMSLGWHRHRHTLRSSFTRSA